jgi:hypothetical protein
VKAQDVVATGSALEEISEPARPHPQSPH